MDVSGIVIAASEVFRFEKGLGMILTVCNTCMNLSFYILVKLSGNRINTLLATINSEFQEILELDLKKIKISSNVLKLISLPRITLNSNIPSLPKLISYQGVITKVKSSNLGLYEVDEKIHLYCIFNSFRSILPVLEEGIAVFISNAHYFIDFMDRKILVCCGLSSVKSLDSDDKNVNNPMSVNVCHYSLSIFDVIWLEMLLSKLHMKFHPSVITSDYSFDWENEIIIGKILECFVTSLRGSLSSFDRISIGDEYCSNPHSCSVFCADILPTGCKIFHISEILDKASNEISWTESSDSWKTCFIKNEMKYILIGMLYLSKDGCWHIMDESCDIPIMFTQRCSQCIFSKNSLCMLNDLNVGYLTVLQNFDIIHEKINFDSNSSSCYRYLKTACCYPLHLGNFCKEKNNLFCSFSAKESSLLKTTQHCSVDEITSLLENTHFDKQDLLVNMKQNCNSHIEDDFNNNILCQYFLVLSKIWTIIDQVFVCYQVLVLLLPKEEIVEEYFDRSRSLFLDTSMTDDDYDFAELVNQMDSLYLEDKPRLARLHFESIRQCALLLSQHIYGINFSDSQDIKFSVKKNNLKPILIKVKPGMKIFHHQECFGNHSPHDYDVNVYCGIKEILSKRKVRENSLIKAVLKNKCYEDCTNSCSSLSEYDVSKTFCMILKDSCSDDTIKVYLPFCPKNLYGFLPGIQLQMYGFICLCSKKGYLYLKPSSSFGIQTINCEPSHYCDASMSSPIDDYYSEEKLRISSLQTACAGSFFKCLCFIMKIVSARLSLNCSSCGRDFEQKCLCFCSYGIKLAVSFIIDDGTQQMLVYSSDEAARKILMLDVEELEKLSSFVKETRSHIMFHYKETTKEALHAFLIKEVFSVYCSSKFLCRQVCLKCGKKSNGTKNEQQAVWCYDVLQISETDIIPELLTELGKINN